MEQRTTDIGNMIKNMEIVKLQNLDIFLKESSKTAKNMGMEQKSNRTVKNIRVCGPMTSITEKDFISTGLVYRILVLLKMDLHVERESCFVIKM